MADQPQFRFAVGAHEVRVWASLVSGMERVWVDGALVSEKRNLRLKSSHEFDVDGARYAVEIRLPTTLAFGVVCEFKRDGATIAKSRLRPTVRGSVIATLVSAVVVLALALALAGPEWLQHLIVIPLVALLGIHISAGISGQVEAVQ